MTQPLDHDDVDDVVEIIKLNKPPANHMVMANLSHRSPDDHIRTIAKHLEIAAKTHPRLDFISARRLSPSEEFAIVTSPMGQNKRKYDMAETCSYLLELKYRYNGEDLEPVNSSMFYTRQAGTTVLFGSSYHTVPVLRARPVTGERKSVFVKLPSDLFSVNTITYPIKLNGHLAGGNLRYAKIHHFNTPVSKRALSTGLVHYLLAKHGYTGMCMRYLGFVPVVGDTQTIVGKYSPKDYMIVATSGFQPKTVVKQHWEPNNIAFAIPKDKYNAYVRDLLTGVLYITDHFYKTDLPSLDSTDFWLDKLAFCILPEDTIRISRDRWTKITSHIDSLERLLPPEQQQSLKEEYRDDPKFKNVSTFFDLLAYIVDSYAEHLHTSNSSAVYDMRMDTTESLLAPIIHRGTRLIYELNSLESKNGGMPIKPAEMQRLLRAEFNIRNIYKIRNKNQAVVPMTATSACYWFKLTSLAATPPIPTPLLNMNMAAVGDHMSMSKANMDPRSRAPAYTAVDPNTGMFIPNEELKQYLIEAQNFLDAAKVHAKEIDAGELDLSEVKEFITDDDESEDMSSTDELDDD